MEMSSQATVTFTAEDGGCRIDAALARHLPDQSRHALARYIKEGYVSVDGTVVTRPSTRVAGGARATVRLPPPAPSSAVAEDLPISIVHEDEHIVVIDKPAGLVVHPSAGHGGGTLVNALLHHVGDLSGIGGELRPGIVHRIDKDTSGLLVVAKHDRAHRALTAAWPTGAVVKEYLAIVYGSPDPPAGRIEAPIGRHPRDRKKMAVVDRGRPAATRYETVEALRSASLVRCNLETGRTHQIRVHLKHLGHPIVGDPLYSGPQWKGFPDKKMQHAASRMERQALHASRLAFPHPESGEVLEFTSPVPDDITALLDALRP